MSDEKLSNELITAAERVLRRLNEGKEPYAANVLPMARALAELARDPAFVLAAAEHLLRDAGVKRVLLSGPPRGFGDFVEISRDMFPVVGFHDDAVDASSLAGGYAELTARKPFDDR